MSHSWRAKFRVNILSSFRPSSLSLCFLLFLFFFSLRLRLGRWHAPRGERRVWRVSAWLPALVHFDEATGCVREICTKDCAGYETLSCEVLDNLVYFSFRKTKKKARALSKGFRERC